MLETRLSAVHASACTDNRLRFSWQAPTNGVSIQDLSFEYSIILLIAVNPSLRDKERGRRIMEAEETFEQSGTQRTNIGIKIEKLRRDLSYDDVFHEKTFPCTPTHPDFCESRARSVLPSAVNA